MTHSAAAQPDGAEMQLHDLLLTNSGSEAMADERMAASRDRHVMADERKAGDQLLLSPDPSKARRCVEGSAGRPLLCSDNRWLQLIVSRFVSPIQAQTLTFTWNPVHAPVDTSCHSSFSHSHSVTPAPVVHVTVPPP